MPPRDTSRTNFRCARDGWFSSLKPCPFCEQRAYLKARDVWRAFARFLYEIAWVLHVKVAYANGKRDGAAEEQNACPWD